MNLLRTPTMLTLFVTVFFGFIGYSLPYPILSPLFLIPTHSILPINTSIHARTILFGVVMALYPIGQFIGNPYLGHAADHFGRKRVLLVSLSVVALSYLITAYAIFLHAFWLLMLGRFFCGLGESAVSIAQSIVADISDHEQLIKRFALLNVATNLGWILGPLIGGRLADSSVIHWFNYATPFYISAGFIVINFLLVLFTLPETIVSKSVKEKAASTISAVLLLFWTNVRKQHLRFYYVYGLLTFIAIFFFFNFYGVFLVQKFHYGAKQIGYYAAYVALILGVSNYLIPRLSKKASLIKLSYFSHFTLALALILFVFPNDAMWLLITFPLVAIVIPGVETISNVLISQAATDTERGAVMGTYRSTMVLAETITALLGGYLVGIAVNLPFLAGALVAIIAGSLMILCRGKVLVR